MLSPRVPLPSCSCPTSGAGEVGYMAGPLTTVWEVVKTGTLPSSVNAPIWALIISALGLVAGLGESPHAKNVC